jgi:serine/threonine-protein kinase RsbW
MPDLSGFPGPTAFRLALACDLAQVREAARAMRGFLAGQGCAEADLIACDLVIVEACNNAIEYALEDRRREPVIIEALCHADELELRITDHTPGFEWPEAATLPDPHSESGRGVYLIRSLMDAVSYIRGSEGNTLVLRKKRRSAAFTPLPLRPNREG